MKKMVSLILILTLVVSLCSMNVSAACSMGHGSAFTYLTCENGICEVKTPTCHWAGGYGGGSFHGEDCQIIQTYCYTVEKCAAPGNCSHSICPKDEDGESIRHLCNATHTQCDMEVDACPY